MTSNQGLGDLAVAAQSEKTGTQNLDLKAQYDSHGERRESITEAAGRRGSVALNIVENPLQVSFASSLA
jgi:hypothetical protein